MDIWSLFITAIALCIALFVWHIADIAIDRQWQRQPMKNFEFTWHGKKFWYSRSVLCVGVVICKDKNGNDYVFATNRGKDGKERWSLPCAYLEFGESAEERVAKSIYNESGLKVSSCDLKLSSVNSEATEFNQNVVLVYQIIIDGNVEDYECEYELNDMEHLETTKWIPIDDSQSCEWVFNHGQIVGSICETSNNEEL